MPAGAHVSFAELQRTTRLDVRLLWALLYQAVSTLRNLLTKGGCVLPAAPPLSSTRSAPSPRRPLHVGGRSQPASYPGLRPAVPQRIRAVLQRCSG